MGGLLIKKKFPKKREKNTPNFSSPPPPKKNHTTINYEQQYVFKHNENISSTTAKKININKNLHHKE